MGSGASKGSVGVPVNPRIQYSKGLEKKEQKQLVVDAPVLVDVDHGTVRYRHSETQHGKGKERPYETKDADGLSNKDHYFYHARLKEYGPDISKEKEDAFKLYYVLKGPASAQQKKLYYVYGQGWGARDGMRLKPTETVGQGKDYAWSSMRLPNSLYYKLDFDMQAEENTKNEEDQLMEDLEPTPDKSKIRFHINPEERIKDVKARLALRLLKSTQSIHVAFNNKELRDEDVVNDLRPQAEEQSDVSAVPADTVPTSEELQSFAIILTLLV